jgi:hypothetical protein
MTTGKKVVRVFMVDETKHGFGVDEHATSAQLIKEVAVKIALKEDQHFALFEVRGDEERCLAADEKPAAVVERWAQLMPSTLKNSADPTNNNLGEFRLVFKKKIFVRDEDESDSRDYDKVAKHLLYIQALHSVIEGEYTCTPEDAVKLAGLQMQVIYGNYNASTHMPGFFGQNLSSFVPKPLMPLKPTKEWELLIVASHKIRTGMSSEEAEMEYLNIVKSWPLYGTKYFKNCKLTTKNKLLPQKVNIGVNLDGIVLANHKDKEQQLGVYYFTDLLSWSTTHNGAQSTFTFEVAGQNNEPVKYTFETKHAEAINDLVQSYVDVLINMIKLDIGHETASPRE